jgi:hypothetical protein
VLELTFHTTVLSGPLVPVTKALNWMVPPVVTDWFAGLTITSVMFVTLICLIYISPLPLMTSFSVQVSDKHFECYEISDFHIGVPKDLCLLEWQAMDKLAVLRHLNGGCKLFRNDGNRVPVNMP